MFLFEFCEIFNNTFFTRTPPDDSFCKMLSRVRKEISLQFPRIEAYTLYPKNRTNWKHIINFLRIQTAYLPVNEYSET